MGKGGHQVEWQTKVDDAYKEWKYNDLHQNIKSYFNQAGSEIRVTETLKQKLQEEHPVRSDINILHDTVQAQSNTDCEKQFFRDSNSNVAFLGTNIHIPEDVADDNEVGTLKEHR